MAENNKRKLRLLARIGGLKADIDNVNQKVTAHEGPGTRESVMDNSTSGFVCPLVGLPEGMVQIPREWRDETKRCNLSPRNLGPSGPALDTMSKLRQHFIEEGVLRCLQLRAQIETKFPKKEVWVLYPNPSVIFPLALMAANQASVEGNLDVIKEILNQEFGYSNQELMEGLFIVSGDQMLVGRVRMIQMLRECDVPGEDFRFILPGLGPLHTLMNFLKMTLKTFLGPKDGSEIGSLYAMNKKLRRQNIDEECTNLWACMDFVKDAGEACTLALLARVSNCLNCAEFSGKVRAKRIDLAGLLVEVDGLLEYSHVEVMRSEPQEKRDMVLENILLFVRTSWEARAFYKSLRGGDVGAIEHIMQIWGPQFVGARQMNYADALMDIRVGMVEDGELDERLKKIVKANWVINPWGRSGKFLALDEFMEEIVRNLKDLYNPGAKVLDNFTREVTARNVVFLMRIKEEVRVAMGERRRGGHHVKQDRSGDVIALADHLLLEDVVHFIPGRGGKEVSDLEIEGYERMNEGEWWHDFLNRSPGCSRTLRNTARLNISVVEQYAGNLFD